MFYSYAVPAAPDFRLQTVRPAEAAWYEPLGEFVLPYNVVQASPAPDTTLLEFLHSTYDAAADTRPMGPRAIGATPAVYACTGTDRGAGEAAHFKED